VQGSSHDHGRIVACNTLHPKGFYVFNISFNISIFSEPPSKKDVREGAQAWELRRLFEDGVVRRPDILNKDSSARRSLAICAEIEV
jgi:hypothetical protein